MGKTILSVAETIMVELLEEVKDMEYMRTHCLAVVGRDVRSARYESEEGRRLYELKMKRMAIESLRRRKFIKLRKEGDRIVCELTGNGKIKALQASIRSSVAYFYDNRRCLISFDFPEAARDARNVFRRFLKSAGFEFVQGSVWSVKKDLAIQLNELSIMLKIQRWVKIFTVIG